jgi:hypothetical protein
MPTRSKPFQRLAGAALGGATFPKAKKLRQTMTTTQLQDFASTPPKAPRAPKMRDTQSAGAMMHPIRNLAHFAHPPRRKK